MEKVNLDDLEFKKSIKQGIRNYVLSSLYEDKTNKRNLRIDVKYQERYTYPNGGNPYDAEVVHIPSEISIYEESLARKALKKEGKLIYHAADSELSSDFSAEIINKTKKDAEKSADTKAKPKSPKEEAFDAVIRELWEDHLTN